MTTSAQESQHAPEAEFDADAMREKYNLERDKRLRPDGNDQYVEVIGDFADQTDVPLPASYEVTSAFATAEVTKPASVRAGASQVIEDSSAVAVSVACLGTGRLDLDRRLL